MLNKCQLIINLPRSFLPPLLWSLQKPWDSFSPAWEENIITLHTCLSRKWESGLSLEDKLVRSIDLMLGFSSRLYLCVRVQPLEFQYAEVF